MNASRYQPSNSVWNQLHQLQQEMNQLFSRWGEDGGRWLGLTASYPPVNVWEDNDQVYVEAELPGLELNDLEIYVTGGNQLTLKGERKVHVPEKGVWHRVRVGPYTSVEELNRTRDTLKQNGIETALIKVRG